MRLPAWIIRVYDHLGLVRTWLALNGAGCVAGGLILLTVPDRLTAGRSMAVIFRYLGRPMWGALFVAIGLICLVGAARKWGRCARFGLVGLFGLQTTWALGLTAPIFIEGRANAFAPLAWVILAASTVLILIVTGGLAPRSRG